MIKIKVKNHEELKLSPFAFGSIFTNLILLTGNIDYPTEEDLKELEPKTDMTIFDCETNPYIVESKTIDEESDIIVTLRTTEL